MRLKSSPDQFSLNLISPALEGVCPAPPKIKKTYDYEMFKHLSFNRSLKTGNLKKLIRLTNDKFQLHLFPILVSESFDIVDGQHRFEVSKSLGFPIYYIVDDTSSGRVRVKDVRRLNIAGMKHSLKDKMEMLYKAKNPEVMRVYALYRKYDKKYSISLIAKLASSFGCLSGGRFVSRIDDSTFKCETIGEAENLLDYLEPIDLDFKYKDKFPMGVAIASTKTTLSLKRFVSRLIQSQNRIKNQPSVQMMVIESLKAYNHGLPRDKKIIAI